MGKIIIKQGDITQENTDIIVNAANKSLLGGGGVDGAIHRAAGPSVLQECKEIGGCQTGEAVMTNAGNLKAKKIIHTVGPVWKGGTKGEDQQLAEAYLNSLQLAKNSGAKSIALPAISTGAYGYPIEEATRIALNVGQRFVNDFEEIRFITFSANDFEIYQRELDKINQAKN